MSFEKDRPGFKERSMEQVTELDELLLKLPVNDQLLKSLSKSGREKLITLAKMAEAIEKN